MLLDTEHSPTDLATIGGMLLAVRNTPTHAVVRVPSNDMTTIKRALDTGVARANDEIALVLQIETPEAVDDLDAICRTPGVDAVFIGPSDLSASYGHRGAANGLEMQAIISKAIAVANAANKAVGILSTDGGAAKYFDQGATLVSVATDIHLIVRACDDLSAKFAPWRGK